MKLIVKRGSFNNRYKKYKILKQTKLLVHELQIRLELRYINVIGNEIRLTNQHPLSCAKSATACINTYK